MDVIQATYDTYHHSDSFITSLINYLQQIELEKGASWLLKKHLENDNKLSAVEVTQIMKLLSQLQHWETKLHILQLLPYLTIKKADKKKLEYFLRACLPEQNKFVRAWTYNGFYLLAKQHREYQSETEELLKMGLRDESASIKARIRNILKNGS